VPVFNFEGDARLAEELHEAFDREVPGFLFAGEDCLDLEYRHFHLSYFRIREGHIPLQRYIYPDGAMMVAATGFNDRDMINLCLLYRYIISYEPFHFRGHLDDFPLTVAYGAQVDELRRRHQGYLWDSEFRDTVGAEVTMSDERRPLYTVFRQRGTGKRAVVVVNPDQVAEMNVSVRLEGCADPLALVTPECPAPRTAGGAIAVPARSAAVLLEGYATGGIAPG
jgi:hypothetical protein